MVKYIISVAAGAIAGFGVGYLVARRKDEKIRKQELEELRAYYKKKMEGNKDAGEAEVSSDENKVEVSDVIVENGYTTDEPVNNIGVTAEMVAEPEETVQAIPGTGLPYPTPYIIESDQFGDQEGYTCAGTWFLYQNGVLIDSNGDRVAMADRDAMIGKVLTSVDALDHFDVESAVYVRNERLKMDFEILYETEDYVDPTTECYDIDE